MDNARPEQNHLLAALAQEERKELATYLEPVFLPLKKIIRRPGEPQPYVYFPTDAVISLSYVMQDGAADEIALIGNDGVVGISAFLGGGSSTHCAIVQSSGTAYRLPSHRLNADHIGSLRLHKILLRYTQALLTQVAQNAACNHHHTVEKRFCRCLLMFLDRLPSNQLALTQESIATLLGVRREGITEAAGKLQKLNIIRYSRGSILLLDRARLEAMSCECYAVVRKESARLLSPGRASESLLKCSHP
jgi:CRP-like cAMP-binding protein